jgi:hypothetical protein
MLGEPLDKDGDLDVLATSVVDILRKFPAADSQKLRVFLNKENLPAFFASNGIPAEEITKYFGNSYVLERMREVIKAL